MAQKRREAHSKLARSGGGGGGGGSAKKRAKHRSGLEIFWGAVLCWDPKSLGEENPLEALPWTFSSAADYYSRLQPPILAEAKAILAQQGSRGTNQPPLSLKPTPGQDPEMLSWGARLLFFDVHKPPERIDQAHSRSFKSMVNSYTKSPLSPEQRELLRPGQVFILRSGTNRPVLATFASGLTRNIGRAALALMVLDSRWVHHEGAAVSAAPLESLLSRQRMFDASIRQPMPPVLAELLCGRSSTHVRFGSDRESDEDMAPSTSDAIPSRAVEAGATERVATLRDVALESASKLNASQIAALADFTQGTAPKLHLVQGPPGTGKTSFLVSVLLHLASGQCSTRGRILVCAPSNKAITLLLERFHYRLGQTQGARPAISLLGVPENISAACSEGSSVCMDL